MEMDQARAQRNCSIRPDAECRGKGKDKGVGDWPGKVESRGRQEAKIHPVPRDWAGDSQHLNFLNRGSPATG